jgi:hypothetical protein
MNQYRRSSAPCHSGLYHWARTRAAQFLRPFVLVCAVWQLLGSAGLAKIERPADAIEVFHCAFDETWDANYDEWPDRWTRKYSEKYAHYVDIHTRETDDPQSTGGRYLELNLDGASAAVSSPPIRVTSRFSYLLTAQVHTSGLKFSNVTLTIDFFDSSGKKLQSRKQELKSRRDGWHTINIGSIDPGDESIDRAIITLEVLRGSRGDLHGVVSLDDVWLARLPRITVTTNCPYNVYTNKNDVVVTCELSGIREQNPEIHYQLLDASSKELHGGSVLLKGRLIEEDTRKASDIVDGIGNAPKGYEGVTEWRPKIPHHGFYSVVVTMLSSDASGRQTDDERKMDRRVIWLAVVAPLPKAAEGDFGWSLTDVDEPLTMQELAGLLPHVGISWVKFPAWYDVRLPRRGDDIIRFVEMLGASNIETVGVIDRPPADSDLAERLGANSSIADLLAFDQSIWLPALDPVMSRLSMRLRYWQFGSDQDTSLVGFPKLAAKIDDIRSRLFRFGQQVKFGVPWLWDGSSQLPADVAWDYEQLTPDPALPLAKFEAFVSRPRSGNTLRWIAIEPPQHLDDASPTGLEELNVRATEFVRRIVAAKEHGVDAIIISRPFDDKNGLMRANGMPAQLLLPWRTTAAMLSGAKFIGSIQLPGGSENRHFLRPDGRVVMVVWNAKRTAEQLFLGNNAEQIDIWGGSTPLVVKDHLQTVDVGPVPTFVLGVNEAIFRWRTALRFDHDHVESIFGKAHPNAIHYKNFFPQGVGGTISIVAPQTKIQRKAAIEAGTDGLIRDSERWSFEPPDSTFNLGPGEVARFPFDIRLKNAMFGEQPIRVDVTVDADEQYQFSIYRTMFVGSGKITIDFTTRLDDNGVLIVEQTMTNSAEKPVDFKCFLYAKGYRRQRAQVYRLGATPDRTVYRYHNGKALLGKELTLEAEEINGERVLKCRFLVTDTPQVKEPTNPAKPTDQSAPTDRQTFQGAQPQPPEPS